MALNAKNVKRVGGGVAQEPVDAGTYPGRVVQILDLGVQEQRPFKGAAKPPVQEIMTTYELVDEFCKGKDGEDDLEKPRWVSETFPFYSLEADLAKSTKRYRALDPDEVHDGDFTLLVSAPCMVTLNQYEGGDGVTRNGVSNVSAMRPKEAAKAPELVNPPKVFVLDNPDMEVFLSLPEWVQDKIKKNLDFNGSALQAALGDAKGPKKDKPKAKVQEQEPEENNDPEPEGSDAPLDEDGNPIW